MVKKVVIILIIAVGLVTAAALWRANQVIDNILTNAVVDNKASHNEPDSVHIRQQELDLPKPNYIAPAITYENYQSKYGPLPRSLRGTTIPASFTVDDQGHLVITKSIKTLIEYFLSSIGEETLEQVIERIREFITLQLEEPARSEAINVMERYLAYKQALVDVEGALAEEVKLADKGSDYLTMFRLRRETRISYLGQEIYDAFFSEDDKQASYIAGQLEIRSNDTLSKEEIAEKGRELERLLPPKEQAHRQKERDREALAIRINEARESGASEIDIFQMRADVYGYEAAERFSKADRENAAWDSRFSDYQQQRQSILDSSALSDPDKELQINALRIELFTSTEQKRIPTLDRIADKKSQ